MDNELDMLKDLLYKYEEWCAEHSPQDDISSAVLDGRKFSIETFKLMIEQVEEHFKLMYKIFSASVE